MAKQTKIQPVSDADIQTGQPSQEATEIQEVTADKFASMSDADKVKYLNDAQSFIKSATQKSQEAAAVKRQSEQLRAENDYWKNQAEEAQGHVRTLVEQVTQSRQPAPSTPSQPPEWDDYDPKGSYQKLQAWHQQQLQSRDSRYDELKKSLDSVKEEFGVGLRTINVERYLEKAIPKLGPQVNADEIILWFNMHPDVQASTETINQAITERQTKIDTLAKERMEQLIAEKEEAVAGVQDAGGSPWAGGAPDHKEFIEMTPSQRDEKVAEDFRKSLKASGGGG